MCMFLCSLQQCSNRMKTYGAIIEVMNNNTQKKVAKNIYIRLGQRHNSVPIFVLRLLIRRRQNSGQKYFLRLTRRQNSAPFFFYAYGEDEKKDPEKNISASANLSPHQQRRLRHRNVAAPNPHVAASGTSRSASVAGNCNFDPNVAPEHNRTKPWDAT